MFKKGFNYKTIFKTLFQQRYVDAITSKVSLGFSKATLDRAILPQPELHFLFHLSWWFASTFNVLTALSLAIYLARLSEVPLRKIQVTSSELGRLPSQSPVG